LAASIDRLLEHVFDLFYHIFCDIIFLEMLFVVLYQFLYLLHLLLRNLLPTLIVCTGWLVAWVLLWSLVFHFNVTRSLLLWDIARRALGSICGWPLEVVVCHWLLIALV